MNEQMNECNKECGAGDVPRSWEHVDCTNLHHPVRYESEVHFVDQDRMPGPEGITGKLLKQADSEEWIITSHQGSLHCPLSFPCL